MHDNLLRHLWNFFSGPLDNKLLILSMFECALYISFLPFLSYQLYFALPRLSVARKGYGSLPPSLLLQFTVLLGS